MAVSFRGLSELPKVKSFKRDFATFSSVQSPFLFTFSSCTGTIVSFQKPNINREPSLALAAMDYSSALLALISMKQLILRLGVPMDANAWVYICLNVASLTNTHKFSGSIVCQFPHKPQASRFCFVKNANYDHFSSHKC